MEKDSERTVESLEDLWKDKYFKEGLNALLSQPSDQFGGLVTGEWLDEVQDFDEDSYLLKAVAEYLYNRTLYGGISPEEAADEILTFVAAQPDAPSGIDFASMKPALELMLRPDIDRLYKRTQKAVLPALQASSLTLDFRLVKQGSRNTLVPVVIAMLGLDTDQEAITFQIPDEALGQLEREIARIRRVGRAAISQLGDQVLAGEVWGSDEP